MRQRLSQLSIPKPRQLQRSIPKKSKVSPHEQELKLITDPIPTATKRTIRRSQETGKCNPHLVTSMELAFLIWNSYMHCIVDIVEHHPTCLHYQELLRITDPIPATKCTFFRSQETGKWMQPPPSYDRSMELASVKWNSETHYIFDIHHLFAQSLRWLWR